MCDPIKANSHIPCRSPAVLIQTCHAVPMPCRVPVILRQCRVLRENTRGRQKYPNCSWDWYASGNNLRGTPRGSRKKPNAGRSPNAVSGRPTLIHTYHAVPMPRCAVVLRGRFQNGMVVAWHGGGTGEAWHGGGTGEAWHVWLKHGCTV
jgi:hypothetical protein